MKKEQVLRFFGKQKDVARALGISQVAVSKWGEEIPPLRAYQLEQLTKGKLKADSYLPDSRELQD